MKLYYFPGACSLAAHIVLHELDVAADLVKVDMYRRTLPDGRSFFQINPLGYVPVLELNDGSRMTEVSAILQYLADLKPDRHLAPDRDAPERYRLQEWLSFISTELHKGFSPLFDPSLPEPVKCAAAERIGKRLEWLSQQLERKPFLMGEQYTVADCYLFTILNWTGHLGIDLMRWPVLQAYQGVNLRRPSVRTAMAAEGLAP